MRDIPYVKIDYCCFGCPYRKRTAIWTNTSLPETLCDRMLRELRGR
jgi:hypothetical protein